MKCALLSTVINITLNEQHVHIMNEHSYGNNSCYKAGDQEANIAQLNKRKVMKVRSFVWCKRDDNASGTIQGREFLIG